MSGPIHKEELVHPSTIQFRHHLAVTQPQDQQSPLTEKFHLAKQCFTFTHQFRSLLRLLEDPEKEMSMATVNKTESMYKNLTNLR